MPKSTKRPTISAETAKLRDENRVEIKPAKGRPMLTWVGKKPLRQATAYPAQLVETFHAGTGASAIGRTPSAPTDWKDWPKDLPQTGLLFHGDNKDVLAYLLANGFRGKVKLIYIDPPFDSGADYVRKVVLRGTGETSTLAGENYSLGEQLQYTDIWTNDAYLQFIYERLLLLKELLADTGVIFVHVDTRRSHHLQCLLDEVFSSSNFQNAISWKRSPFAGSSKARAHKFPANHDILLFYSRSEDFFFKHEYSNYSEGYLNRFKNPDNDPKGSYRLTSLKSYSKERFEQWKAEGRLIPPKKPGAGWSYKQYLSESKGVQADDYWDDVEADESMWGDINLDNPMANVRTDYPTQKPEALLERIISTTTDSGEIVLDCFIGSGTTAAVAQKMGRRWIGADINKGAIQTTVKRLQGVIEEQADLTPQPPLPLSSASGTIVLKGERESTPTPAQLGFAVYRVNDYDLQMQHNEAFNLAVEHLGMTRSKTDRFFDGTLGKKLVKIVPFNHPITALDLEEVKNELNARPEEERDIVVVGLGKEIAVEAWLEEWNKLRKQSNVPNKIEVIELRSDPKYGGFFTHEPAKAKVSFKKVPEGLEITIEDFISPTILERLRQQNKDNPLFQPQVSDWRSMVDSVMIDAAYDGKAFNITLADVPERKNDLVEGKYVVPVKKGARAAVKVTDMLGEEVLVVKEV